MVLARFVDEDKIERLVDFCSGSGIVGMEVAGRVSVGELSEFEIQKRACRCCKVVGKI